MSFGESIFQQGYFRKPKREIKMSNRTKFNHDENYSRRFQRTPGGNPPRQTLRGYQVGSTGPTTIPLDSLWGPLVRSF
jgi:hypothetical protein